MPILQPESGLSVADYNTLEALTTGAAYQFVLQRINFVFTSADTKSRTALWDACLCTDSIIRTYLVGTTLAAEKWNGTSWDALNIGSITSVTWITPSIVSDGSDVRIYYVTGGALKYIESTDDGDTWGGAQTVVTKAGIDKIAASALGTVHMGTFSDSGSNTHLWRYDETDETESDIYFPGQFGSFDAERIDGRDVLVFTALGQVRYTAARQGAWAIRQKNGRWSDPIEMDVLDEYEESSNERLAIRLGQFNKQLWATFVSRDDGHTYVCYFTSEKGKHWQHRQPMGALSVEGKLILLGNDVFFLDDEDTWSSASTVLSGNSTVEEDITSALFRYNSSRQKMYQTTLVLHNNDGSFDSYLSGYDRYQVVESLGYWDSGSKILQQTALLEVDTYTRSKEGSDNMVVLSCRDRLAWMADRTEADHYEEWVSQLRHRDDFGNTWDATQNKEILYSGMRHTATMDGMWSTSSDELHLQSDNSEGLAMCTVSKFIGHTINQEGFQVPTASNDEWAGVIFRALDEDNHWCAYYDEGTDKIKLRQKDTGVWQTSVAETGALSWSVATWYYIRVEARLSLFKVYYSTDGIAWTLGITYIDITGTTMRAHYKEGYVGHAGYGYSDEDAEPVEPDPYVPPNPEGDFDAAFKHIIVGSRTAGVAFCDTEEYVANTHTWELMNTGLTVPGAHYIKCLKIQKVSASERWVYAGTNCGIYRCRLPAANSNEWEYRLPTVDIQVACGYAGIAHVQDIIFDWSLAGHAWAKVTVSTWSPYQNFIIETWDSFATCTVTGAAIGTGYEGVGTMAVNRHNTTVLLAHGQSGGGGALKKSTNGGTTWLDVDTSQPWQGSHGWWGYASGGKYAWWAKSNVAPILHSKDYGVTWADALYDGTEIQNIRAASHDHRTAFLIAYDGVETWNAITEEFDQFKQNTNMYCQDAKCLERLSDRITPVYFAMVGGGTNSAESWLASAGDLADRTGNLHTILLPEREGSADDIDCIALEDWKGGLL